jgi:hypothetical protein
LRSGEGHGHRYELLIEVDDAVPQQAVIVREREAAGITPGPQAEWSIRGHARPSDATAAAGNSSSTPIDFAGLLLESVSF